MFALWQRSYSLLFVHCLKENGKPTKYGEVKVRIAASATQFGQFYAEHVVAWT